MNQVEALSPEARAQIKKSDFVFPERRGYPIDNPERAMDALTMARWPKNKKDFKAVLAAVKRRYPDVAAEFMGGKFDKGKKPRQESAKLGDDPVIKERLESIRGLVAEANGMSGTPEAGSVAAMFSEMCTSKKAKKAKRK